MNLMNKKQYFKAITNIHGILKLWGMRHVSTESKIVVFMTLAISKLVFLALLTFIPNHTIDEVAERQQSFIWDH